MRIILCALLAFIYSHEILSSSPVYHDPKTNKNRRFNQAALLKDYLNEQNEKLVAQIDQYPQSNGILDKITKKIEILDKITKNPQFNPNAKIHGITLAQLIFGLRDLDLTSAVLQNPHLNLEEKNDLDDSLLHIIWDRLQNVSQPLKNEVYKTWLIKKPDNNIKEVLDDTSCSDACKKKGFEFFLDDKLAKCEELLKNNQESEAAPFRKIDLSNYINKLKTKLKNKKEQLKNLKNENLTNQLTELIKSRDLIKNKNSGVFQAAILADVKTLKILHDLGVNMNIQDNEGYTPAHFAAEHKNTKALEALREMGADMNIQNNDGNTPAHLVARSDRAYRVATPGSNGTIITLHDLGFNMNIKNHDGNTPAHLAALYNKQPETLKALREMGADMTIKNKGGQTPEYLFHLHP